MRRIPGRCDLLRGSHRLRRLTPGLKIQAGMSGSAAAADRLSDLDGYRGRSRWAVIWAQLP